MVKRFPIKTLYLLVLRVRVRTENWHWNWKTANWILIRNYYKYLIEYLPFYFDWESLTCPVANFMECAKGSSYPARFLNVTALYFRLYRTLHQLTRIFWTTKRAGNMTSWRRSTLSTPNLCPTSENPRKRSTFSTALTPCALSMVEKIFVDFNYLGF